MANQRKSTTRSTPRRKTSRAPGTTTRARTAKGPSRAKRSNLLPLHTDIEVRAYYLFLERGGQPGGDLDDWLRAERELKTGVTVPMR